MEKRWPTSLLQSRLPENSFVSAIAQFSPDNKGVRHFLYCSAILRLLLKSKLLRMNLLEAQGLKKYYATQKAVDDISFSIAPGTIFGLLGPNGAGKTTLLRMITGILFPDEGRIILEGKDFDPVKDIEK